MDELQGLERVQRMLSFMEVRGLSTDNHDSDRFLAQFLLFLVHSSESLNMQQKCEVISECIHKISDAILVGALLDVTEDRQQICADVPSSVNHHNKLNLHLPEVNKCENVAMIGLDCMQRANSTLEDFVRTKLMACRSYFMFHGMESNNPQNIFRFLPVLSFTESYIYELDNMNEESLQSLTETVAPEDDTNDSNYVHDDRVATMGVERSFLSTPGPESFDQLIHLLHCKGLLTEQIRTELQSGIEYWELERKLCYALAGEKKISIEDVIRAVHLKSFDYRVLNLLLYQLRNQEVNDLHMEFLSISEFLVEVSDDLYDYEDDVMENNFNILRMLVAVYGSSAAPAMLAKYITEAEKKYECLSKALDPELSSKYLRRCEEATKEGGSTSESALGTWCIPPVITDENSFRLQAIGKSPSRCSR